jgi:hypothetical protein
MKFNSAIFQHLRLIAVVSLAPAFVLASEPTFVHASVLDPSVPPFYSAYLDALGGLFPWWITEVPPELRHVSVADRLNVLNLMTHYLISVILVAILWILVRTALQAATFVRRAA